MSRVRAQPCARVRVLTESAFAVRLVAVAAQFPLLSRLMSTPLLCRDTVAECARDLLQKRDSLLLLREGSHGAVASAQTVAAVLGTELKNAEHSCAERAEQVGAGVNP